MRITLLLLMLLSGTLQAQNRLADSLLAELAEAQTDSARVIINCGLSKRYLYSDARKAMEYGQAAEGLAAATGFAHGRAKALNLLGNSHLIMGQYDRAMGSYYKALKIGEQIHDTATLTSSYINLGNVYFKIKDPARAVRNYLLAAKLARKVNDELRLSNVLNNMGNIYEEKGEYRQALSYFRRAASLQEKLGDKRSWAISLHNIGNVHLFLAQPEKGLPYLFKSVRLNEKIQNDMIRMASLGKIAVIYQAIGNNEEALKYARQSFDMAVKVESSKKIAEAARIMQAVYASKKDYEQAYKYLSILDTHNEILNAESRTKIESEMTAKYETEQKELENQRLKAEREKQEAEIRYQQNTLVLGGAVTALLLFLVVVLCVSRQRLKAAYARVQEAHHLMQAQQTEIITQRNEISSQAVALKEQNMQLARHSVFKDKVFSIISHDLRGPFNSLRGILKLSQRRTMSEREVKHIFGLLGKDVDVAINMLDNVLIWAKAQLEVSSVELEPVNLFLLAEENIQLARAHADKKSLRLINGIPEGAVTLADRERLNFVLRNLLMNAMKFSYTGGEIRFELEERDQETTIAVSDKGKGISPENLAKLFKARRFTSLGTSGEKGTGLGLMLCKELVESFNGRISVESVEGKGSVFLVALPKACIVAEGEGMAEVEFA